MSDEIAAFIEARLAEDAKRWKTLWLVRQGNKKITGGWDGWGDVGGAVASILDTTRGGREVAAKRKRLALYLEAKAELEAILSGTPKAALSDDPATTHSYSRERIKVQQASGRFIAFETAVKLDAMVYADHPDFRPEWRLA